MSFFKKISFWSVASLLLCACTDYVQKIDDRYGEWEMAKCGNTLVLKEALDATSVEMIQSSVQPILIVMRKSKDGDMLIYGLYANSFEEIPGSSNGVVYDFTGVLRDENGNVVDNKLLDGDKIAFNFPYNQEYWNSDEYKQIQENYAANGIDELTFNSLIEWTQRILFYVVGSSGNMIAGWPKSLEEWASVSTDLNTCSATIDMGNFFINSRQQIEYGELDAAFGSVEGEGASSSSLSVAIGSMTDFRDGQTYKTVVIGTQTWMAENLNFKTDSSFCDNNRESYCNVKYGRLYRWAAAVGKSEAECGYGKTCSLPSGNIQGVCPSGWHLPSKAEWETLFNAVGGISMAGMVLKSTSGWKSNGNGTDAFGFSALPVGFRNFNGEYEREGERADFWSSTEYEYDGDDAYFIGLRFGNDRADLVSSGKYDGFPVRCLKD